MQHRADSRRGRRALLDDGFLPITRCTTIARRRDRRPAGCASWACRTKANRRSPGISPAFLARAARDARRAGTRQGWRRPTAVLFNGGFFTPGDRARPRRRGAGRLVRANGAACARQTTAGGGRGVGAAYYAHLRALPERMRRLLIRAGSAARPTTSASQSGDVADTRQFGVPCLPRHARKGTHARPRRARLHVLDQPSRVAFTLYSSLDRTMPPAIRHARWRARRAAPARAARERAALRQAIAPGGDPRASVRAFHRARHAGAVVQSAEPSTAGGCSSSCAALTAPQDVSGRGRLQGRDEVLVPDDAIARAERLAERCLCRSASRTRRRRRVVAQLETLVGYGKGVAGDAPAAPRRSAAADARRTPPGASVRSTVAQSRRLLPASGVRGRGGRVADRRDPKGVRGGARVSKGRAVPGRVADSLAACRGRFQRRSAARAGAACDGPTRDRRAQAAADEPADRARKKSWRLLAALERLDRDTRVRLGEELLARVRKDPRNGSLLWALGRLGARRPFYGPLDSARFRPRRPSAGSTRCSAWPVVVPDALGAIAQIATRVDDSALDIDERHRAAVLELLATSGAASM